MLVQRSVLVDRPAHQMFDLIERAEDYPRFLPWCAGATIVERSDALVSADIRVRFAGLGFEFRTRNPKGRPLWMDIGLVHGPFRHFRGEWRLKPLGEGACKVDFMLDYAFDSGLVTRVAAPVFDRITDTLVDLFVQRAMSLPPAAPEGGGSST